MAKNNRKRAVLFSDIHDRDSSVSVLSVTPSHDAFTRPWTTSVAYEFITPAFHLINACAYYRISQQTSAPVPKCTPLLAFGLRSHSSNSTPFNIASQDMSGPPTDPAYIEWLRQEQLRQRLFASQTAANTNTTHGYNRWTNANPTPFPRTGPYAPANPPAPPPAATWSFHPAATAFASAPMQNAIDTIYRPGNALRAPSPTFGDDFPLVPADAPPPVQQAMPRRPIPALDRVGRLNPGARVPQPIDARTQPLFPQDPRVPQPGVDGPVNQTPRPAMFDQYGIVTPYGIGLRVMQSATDADDNAARFPLGITQNGPFVAPIPFVTRGDRRLQQTTPDTNLLGQIYIVDPPIADDGCDAVNTTRIELGRYGTPNYQLYPRSPTFPARQNAPGGQALPLQTWLPPHIMPRHPTMAYWGRDLNNAALALPVLRPYGGGRIRQQPMFLRATDGDRTDRGWGPGVQVHPSMQQGLARATEAMQEWVVEQDAARLDAEQREREQQAAAGQQNNGQGRAREDVRSLQVDGDS